MIKAMGESQNRPLHLDGRQSEDVTDKSHITTGLRQTGGLVLSALDWRRKTSELVGIVQSTPVS